MAANMTMSGERTLTNRDRGNPIRHSIGSMAGTPNSPTNALAQTPPVKMARGLGMFSVALGLTQLFAPRALSHMVGLNGDHILIIRMAGMRELTHGLAILGQGKPASGVWSRVAGDAMDLTLMGAALLAPETKKARLAFFTALVAGITALDVLTARQLTAQSTAVSKTAPVHKSIIINRSPAEVYAFWRNFENLPQFMNHLVEVQTNGDGRSHWVAQAPLGTTVEWDAVLTDDVPDRRIGWQSLQDSDVKNFGTVEFEPAPHGDGTLVRVELYYTPPLGVLGVSAAKLTGEEPSRQVEGDLRRLKQVMETGEVVISEGTLKGNSMLAQRKAQPPADGYRNGNGARRTNGNEE